MCVCDSPPYLSFVECVILQLEGLDVSLQTKDGSVSSPQLAPQILYLKVRTHRAAAERQNNFKGNAGSDMVILRQICQLTTIFRT